MKYLVLFGILLLVYLLWRHERRSSSKEDSQGSEGEGKAARTRRRKPASPQEMVQCTVCSVHLPRADALPDPSGRLYCCAEHRHQGSGQ